MTTTQHPPVACVVVVASDQSLLAEAVRVALRARGFEVTLLRWPGAAPLPRRTAGPAPRVDPDAGLLLGDLDSPSRVRAARTVLRGTTTRWMVVTSIPVGATWGGMFEAGARRVVPSALSLDEIEVELRALAAGPVSTDLSWRASLVADWDRQHGRRTELAERLDSLTARERQVLGLLYDGSTVVQIAQELRVAPATVRSQVKAVLHKLGVSSQLAAVSVLDTVDETDPGLRPRG